MKKLLISFILLFSLCLYGQQKGAKPIVESRESKVVSQNTYAVVVGISDYQDPGIQDLRFADKDAEAFAGFLRSNAGGKLDPDHLKVLINKEATMAQFANALDWLWEVCKEGDEAIIYFSGHGDVEKKSLTQPGFLLCWDAPARVYMAGGAFALPMLQEVVSTLSIQNKAKVIVITDACRSGTLAGSSVGGAQATAANLAKQFGNEIKIMSCQPNEYSIEGEQWGGGRGAFSYHLLNALYGMADNNKDLWVSLQEVGRYLEDHVTTEVAPVSQVPMTVGNRNERLTSVDEKMLASILSGKNIQSNMLSSIDSRGVEEDVLSKLDTNSKTTYQLFKSSLKNKNFLEPLAACANTYYEQLINEPKLQRLHSNMKRNYAAALQDDAQQVINIWLKADVKELDCIGKSIPLDPLPMHLKKAAELLGKQHYMYSYLTARQLLFEGILQIKDRNPDAEMGNRVLEKYYQALMLEPSSPILWHQMSLTYVKKLRNLDSALICASKAVNLSPQWVLPYTNLFYEFIELGKSELAEKVLQSADSIQANHPYVIQAKAFLKRQSGDFDGAIFAYKAYLEAKGPLYPCWFSDYAILLTEMEKFEEAESIFKSGLQLDSTNATIMANLAMVYLKTKKIEEAEMWLQKAYNLDSTSPHILINFSQVLVEKNELEKAELYLKNANKLDSTSSYIWNNLGMLYLSKNQIEKGIEALKNSIKYNSKNHVAVVNLSRLYHFMGIDSLAEQTLIDFLNHNTNQVSRNSVLGSLGFFYLKRLKFNNAVEVYKELVVAEPNNLINHNNLAFGYLSLGKYNESEILFKQILSKDSTNFPSWGNLGEIYLKTGRYEEAEKFLEKSMSIYQNWVYSWSNFGALYLKTNQYQKAEEYLKHALTIDSLFTDAMVYLAHVFIKTNRQEEALKYFQNAIRINPMATNAYLGLAAHLTTLGKSKEALDMIEQAILKIGVTFEALQKDNDLAQLRNQMEWEALMKKYFPDKHSK